MAADGSSAAAFYGTARGRLTSRLLSERLVELWPSLAGLSVLGLGYAGPYLGAWRGEAGRCISACPVSGGVGSGVVGPGIVGSGAVGRWPAGAANLACAVEDSGLPFADLQFDRILVVHGLELAENARATLREAWRLLKDDGRMIAVTPNRRGMWAHAEGTPFGHGQPYSPGQIDRLLAAHLFRVERRAFALFMPPSGLRTVLRTARLWERAGRRYASHLGGVTVTEAIKDAYAAIPLARGRKRVRVVIEAG